ncbi:MAG: hypothetical protein Q8K79_12590 [Solirubrobacteraceae bacterium]|nr:hypothetical protein [Solirubrobacteraceae bacterium]
MRALRIAAPALAATLLLALTGCSKQEREVVPVSCFGQPRELMTALRQAPGAVVLEDGTHLSGCVSRARSDGDLQSLGVSFGRLADALRARAQSDASAALQLGYLAGAVQAGARGAPGGLADQFARRMQQLAVLRPGATPAAASELARGMRAGEGGG